MLKKQLHVKFLKENKYAFLGLGCTALIVLIIYLANVIYPIGSNTILCVDLLHQYAPLYAELWDKLMNGGSLLFSWESAGGAAWLGNFFNYLSSPFTFLIFLFPRENITEAIALIILLKASLSSFTFSYFIGKKTENKTPLIAAFGVLYACCGWFVAYYWNVMWLDAVYLLPLVALGIERIIDKKGSALYIAALAGSFITSYYMAYMICIFSVAYFIYYFFSTNSQAFEKGASASLKSITSNPFINRGLNFAFSSVGAVLLCAIVILPLISTLGASTATKDTFPESFEAYFNIFDFAVQHFTGVEPTIRCSNVDMYLPNVSSGVLTIILIPLFFLSKTITKKEKALSAGLLLFLASGFYINYLDFIWHGFHFPNDMPYRYSFMYSFVLLILAFKGLERIKEIPSKYIKYTAAVIGLFLLFAQKIGSENFTDSTFWINLIFVGVYSFGLFVLKNNQKSERTVALLLLLLVCAEYTIGNCNKFTVCVPRDDYSYDYEDYLDIREQTEKADEGFYRLELLKAEMKMSPCRYGYNGINYFSSMASEGYTDLNCRLGMESNKSNSCTYNSQTPIYNSFFGIKYVYINKMNSSQFLPGDFFDYQNQNIGYMAFENKYFLPLGFAVDEAITRWDIGGLNTFKNQADLFKKATGVKNALNSMEISDIDLDNVKLNKSDLDDSGVADYSVKYKGDASINVTLKATESGEAYVYALGLKGTVETADISTSVGTVSQKIGKSPYIIYVGNLKKGEIVDIALEIPYDEKKDELAEDKLYVYGAVVDKSAFEKGYEKLQANPLNITEFSDTYFSGTITMPENSVLYTSVPYDKGWHITVDGKSADEKIVKIGDALIGVDLDAGEHIVEFTYSAPGLSEGIIISATTLAILVVLFIIKKSKKN